MAVTYYVALPFRETDEGPAPGEAMECPTESAALSTASVMARDPANVGALAFKRRGEPNLGDFSAAIVLRTYGKVPRDLSEL